MQPALDQANLQASSFTLQDTWIFHACPSISCDHIWTKPSSKHIATELEGIPRFGRHATSLTAGPGPWINSSLIDHVSSYRQILTDRTAADTKRRGAFEADLAAGPAAKVDGLAAGAQLKAIKPSGAAAKVSVIPRQSRPPSFPVKNQISRPSLPAAAKIKPYSAGQNATAAVGPVTVRLWSIDHLERMFEERIGLGKPNVWREQLSAELQAAQTLPAARLLLCHLQHPSLAEPVDTKVNSFCNLMRTLSIKISQLSSICCEISLSKPPGRSMGSILHNPDFWFGRVCLDLQALLIIHILCKSGWFCRMSRHCRTFARSPSNMQNSSLVRQPWRINGFF